MESKFNMESPLPSLKDLSVRGLYKQKKRFVPNGTNVERTNEFFFGSKSVVMGGQ